MFGKKWCLRGRGVSVELFGGNCDVRWLLRTGVCLVMFVVGLGTRSYVDDRDIIQWWWMNSLY